MSHGKAGSQTIGCAVTSCRYNDEGSYSCSTVLRWSHAAIAIRAIRPTKVSAEAIWPNNGLVSR